MKPFVKQINNINLILHPQDAVQLNDGRWTIIKGQYKKDMFIHEEPRDFSYEDNTFYDYVYAEGKDIIHCIKAHVPHHNPEVLNIIPNIEE